MITADKVQLIEEMVHEVLKECPIDFGMLSLDEHTALRLAIVNILERVENVKDPSMKESVLTAIAAHQVLENMVLNIQLLQKNS